MRSGGAMTSGPVAAFALMAMVLTACSAGDSGSATSTLPTSSPSSAPPMTPIDTAADPADPSDDPADPSDDPADPSGDSVPTTIARETMTVVRVDPETGEVTEVDEPKPGPSTYNEVVDFGIEAGLWDEIGGLERVLGYIAGGITAEEVPGVDDVDIEEYGEVLGRANRLAIDAGASDAELADVRRWYEMLVPSSETLAAIAKASSEAPRGFAMRQPGSTPESECAPVDVDSADANIWVVGCYLMIEADLGDALLRVFYPDWYESDGNLASIAPTALGALVRSVETFRPLGNVGDIDVIMSAVQTTTFTVGATAGVTAQWRTETVVGCPISVNPAAANYPPELFEQIVAHEAWHCTQHYDGFPTTVVAGSGWYREGGAHYFSNVAYPNADYEHYSLVRFDDALEKPIFDMSYEAWILWQYLGNQNGARAVADLHREMTAAGSAAGQSMRPYQEQFHDFTVDYVAGTVLDQSGERLPRPTRFHRFPLVDRRSAGSSFELRLEPMTVMRWAVTYDKQLRVLEMDASTHALNSMVKWTERSDRPAWRGIHPEVRSSCRNPTKYVGASTNTEFLNTVKVTIDVVEQASCDPCLLGTWSLDLVTFQNMILGGIGGAMPAGTSFEIGGAYYIAFAEESVILEQRDGLLITASSQGFSIPITINSFAEGEYNADGGRVTFSNLVESYNEVTVDAPIPFTTTVPSVIEQGFGSYACRDDTLEVTADGFEAITFTRVDKILEPPESPAGDS